MLNAEIAALEEQEAKIMAEGFVQNVYNDLNDIKHSFFVIGFRLTEANDLKYYKALGYQNITELAEDKFGFKKTVTYELMQIYALAHNAQSPMRIADKYDKYSKSQLAEFCRLRFAPDSFIKMVSPKDSVAKIKPAVTFWNKYTEKNSCTPEVNNIDELLLLAEKAEKQRTKNNQLPGQTVIDISEVQNVEEFNAVGNFSGNPENSEVTDEPETIPEAAGMRAESEIIKVGLTGVDIYVKDAKFQIVDRYRNKPLEGNFSRFIKSVYNYNNKRDFYHGYCSKEDNMNRSYSEKGIELVSFDPYQNIKLTWEEVALNISDLIYTGDYLSDAEQEQFLQWKAAREGLVVNVEPAAEPAPEITKPPIEIGKKTNWEYLQTCNTRANFLFVVTQGVKSMPEDFGDGMPDRIYKWLQIWLEKPVAL